MDVREIRDAAAWGSYESAWRRVVDASPNATVFQTWEWLRTWWDHYGRHKRLRILVFLEDKTAVGFAPLFLPGWGRGPRVARLLGAGVSDYGDLLALPGCEAEVTAALFGFFEQKGAWDGIDLQQLRPGSVALHGLPGWRAAGAPVWPGENCPFVVLPPSWEAFRAGLGKKLRGNLGYYERALAKLYRVDIRMATAPTLEADMDAFFDLHQARWNRRWLPGVFARGRTQTFHQSIARRLLHRGALRLHTLSLDGEIEAALYCFQFKGRCTYYGGGFNPERARLSIGTVLTARAIRQAIEGDGATEFDFLRGDEPYKYRWGAQDRANSRLFVARGGVGPRLLQAWGRRQLQAELALKTWMHRRHR